MPDISYYARPFVCGAVGRWDPDVLGRLVRASPQGVHKVSESGLAALWSSGPLTAYAGGHYWWPLANGRAPTRWQEAAGDRLAAGVVTEGDTSTLHTCALGLQELYVRFLGGAVYFAVRIEPLLALDDSPLHTDWAAWASILALGCPVGEATPFVEVRRMGRGTAWGTTGGTPQRTDFAPRWLTPEPGRGTPATIAELVADLLPRADELRRTGVLLSGGWDSRLLAALAVSRSRCPPLAWTTSPDDGLDLDVDLARTVADGLGLTHQVVIPGPEAWLEEYQWTRRRVQHQTWMHTWMAPLAKTLHPRRELLLDGLAGDVLIKSLYVDHAVLQAHRTGGAWQPELWRRLAGGRTARPDLLTPAASAWIQDTSQSAFASVAGGLDSHPGAPTLAVLLTRTARAIATSPLWVLGPEVAVEMPFVQPGLIAAALAVPTEEKVGGEFYRQVLDVAAGPVGRLPSTNDPRQPTRRGPTRQGSQLALARMAAAVIADEGVLGLFAEPFQTALGAAEGRSWLASGSAPQSLLQGASMLADWRRAYASRLASTPHPTLG